MSIRRDFIYIYIYIYIYINNKIFKGKDFIKITSNKVRISRESLYVYFN